MKCPNCRTYMRFRDIERWERYTDSQGRKGTRYETAFFRCPRCNNSFSGGIVRAVSFDKNGEEVEVEEREQECPNCGRLMPRQVRICRVCGAFVKDLADFREDEEKYGFREHVAVHRCPVDGLTYGCGHAIASGERVIGTNPSDRVEIHRCIMCGTNVCLIGPEGIYHGVCQNCGREDYTVDYRGRFVCGTCLYALGIEDEVITHY